MSSYKRFSALSRIVKTQTTGFIGRVDIDELLVTLALCGLMSSTHPVPRKHYVCTPHFSCESYHRFEWYFDTFVLKIVAK